MNKAHLVLRISIYLFGLLLFISMKWWERTPYGSPAEAFADFLGEVFLVAIIVALGIKLLLDIIVLLKRVIKA